MFSFFFVVFTAAVRQFSFCQFYQTNFSLVTAIEKASPSSRAATPRENNCTPTEEFVDESDDNWESYSSDDSDDDMETVDNNNSASADIQRQPNRKNVGIIDTIARLHKSISSQGTSSVEGVEKLSETTSPISSVSGPQVHADKLIAQPEDEVADAVQSTESEIQIEKENKVPVTYQTIVSETMQLGSENVEGAHNAKQCVSNGRSPNGNYSFSFKGNDTPASQLGSRKGNIGGSSSNADSTNNDVDMVDVNKPAKILTRIDNIGYTRSTAAVDSSVTFCCLIDDCGFESTDLSDLLSHIDDHPVEWYGFCYTCNAQIKNNRVQLMMEFMHMTQAHYNKKDDEPADKANTAGRPLFIKCKTLPGDKLSKLKEEEIAAKAEQLSINSKPSTSTTINEPKFIEITLNPKSLASSVKSSISSMVISKVVSLGSSSKDYNDSEPVSLKIWNGTSPVKKLQKHCKKMLRDICLYALFKCMDISCAFTTDNADNMLIHLRNHDNVSSEPTWLECSYCDIVADSSALLVKHVQDEHQSSIFQCPYCFYRSCAAFNVMVHLKQYHGSEKKAVLVCNGKPRLYATEKALIEKSRGENIRPLRCTEGKSAIVLS